MGEVIQIDAKQRDKAGKQACKEYRRQGYIPSVMYGQGNNINLMIDNRDFMKKYPNLTKSTLINLNVDDKTYEVLIKDFDKDYIKEKFLHIDFYELKKGKTLHTTVSLNFLGNAPGIREGGILEKHIDKVEIECLPKDIVNHFDVDISKLKINQSIHVRDLSFDKKYKLLTDLDEVIVKISGKISSSDDGESETEEDAE